MQRIESVVVGALLIAFLVWSQQLSAEPPTVEVLASRGIPGAMPPPITLETRVDDSFAALAKSDPVGAFRSGLARYEARVHDYTCTFEKQERVGGRLTAVQVTQVRFREQPFSVHIDKEYLLPTSCTSYADEAQKELLGQYVLSDVRFNVGLTDNDFTRKGG